VPNNWVKLSAHTSIGLSDHTSVKLSDRL